jgi:hypothetical protein
MYAVCALGEKCTIRWALRGKIVTWANRARNFGAGQALF